MPNKARIFDIMTTNVFTVNIEDTVKEVENIMQNEKVRHVLVIDGTKVVGRISENTIKEYTLRQIYDGEQTYGELGYNQITDFEKIMTRVSHVIYPEDSVAKAVKMFAKYKLECLPVVDWEMNLIGIVTTTDLLLFFNKYLEEMEFVP